MVGLLVCSSQVVGEGFGKGLIRLKSGREVLVGEKKLKPRLSQDLYQEAIRFFKEGRIELVLENCRLLEEEGAEEITKEASDLIEKIDEAEYSSIVVLEDGQTFKGKVTAQLNPDYIGLHGQKVTPRLRTDYLGLEGQKEVPFWSMISLQAEYQAKLSNISGYYYLTTVLEIQFRGKPQKAQRTSRRGNGGRVESSTISKEIWVHVDDREGNVRHFVMGHDYQMLKEEDLAGQVEELTRGRVKKIHFYPLLDEMLHVYEEGKEGVHEGDKEREKEEH